MGFNFPNAPALNDKFSPLPGLNYIWDGLTWVLYPYRTALPFNHVVNGAFQISQEYGTTPQSVAAYHFADQWMVANAPGTFANTRQRGASSPGRDSDCLVTVTTIKSSYAAGDYFIPAMQNLEGHRMAGFQWGSSGGVPMVVRFTLPAMPAAASGTHSFWVRNAGSTRSYVATFNVVGGYNLITLTIPPCLDGVWPADNTQWGGFGFTFGIGTTYATTPNTWVNANMLGATGQSNAAAILTNFAIADVGIYMDPFSTGLAPKWEPLTDEKALAECQRYWYPLRQAQGCTTGAYCAVARARHPMPMRTTPAISIINSPAAWEYNAGSATIIQIDNYSSPLVYCGNLKTNGSFNTARACQMLPDGAGYLAVSARM